MKTALFALLLVVLFTRGKPCSDHVAKPSQLGLRPQPLSAPPPTTTATTITVDAPEHCPEKGSLRSR